MAEQPLSSDRETALAPSAPAQRAPPEMPRARRWPWSGITIVWLAVLLATGVIVVLLRTAVAMPHRPVDRDLLRRTDWAGIVYAGIGFGLIYAGSMPALIRATGSTGSIQEW
jgi:hypothetical protein